MVRAPLLVRTTPPVPTEPAKEVMAVRSGAAVVPIAVSPSSTRDPVLINGVVPVIEAKPSPASQMLPAGVAEVALVLILRELSSTGVLPLEEKAMRPSAPALLVAVRVVCWPLLPPPTIKGETAVPKLVAARLRVGAWRLTLAWAIGLALRPPSRRAPVVVMSKVPAVMREPRARSEALERKAEPPPSALANRLATSLVVTLKRVVEVPMLPLVLRSSMGPRLLVTPVPVESWVREVAVRLSRPEVETDLTLSAPAEERRMELAAVADTEPVEATLRGVLRRRVTPIREDGSVSRVPVAMLRGWLVVVELAFWEPMERAVQRVVLP